MDSSGKMFLEKKNKNKTNIFHVTVSKIDLYFKSQMRE